jgi:hypothetical protein
MASKPPIVRDTWSDIFSPRCVTPANSCLWSWIDVVGGMLNALSIRQDSSKTLRAPGLQAGSVSSITNYCMQNRLRTCVGLKFSTLLFSKQRDIH